MRLHIKLDVQKFSYLAARNIRPPVLHQKPIREQHETVKWVIVLSATIDEIDKPMAEAVVAHLRKLSNDSSITLQRVEAGSVRLILESSQATFELIKSLVTTKQLSDVSGIRIQKVTLDQELLTEEAYRLKSNILKNNILESSIAPSYRVVDAANLRTSSTSIIQAALEQAALAASPTAHSSVSSTAQAVWTEILQWAFDGLYNYFETHLIPNVLDITEQTIRLAFYDTSRTSKITRNSVREAWQKIRKYLLKAVLHLTARPNREFVRRCTYWIIKVPDSGKPVVVKVEVEELLKFDELPRKFKTAWVDHDQPSIEINFSDIRDRELEAMS